MRGRGGQAILAVAALLWTGCSGGKPKAAAQVDGERAFQLARQLCTIGPRVSGTPGAKQAARFIADTARAYGCDPEIREWGETTPAGTVTFRNVLVRIPGTGRATVVLGSHYDTKYLPDFPDFVGANDSASSTGLLLEIIRTLADNRRRGPDLLCAFFDGEECRVSYGKGDGLHGSLRLAAEMAETGELARTRAMILLDMVGDRELTVTIPRDSDPALVRAVFAAAERQGTRSHFSFFRGNILDDHVPFQQRGVPAINLIDFEYGPANRYWHTREDTLDKLSPKSLEIVGNVVVEVVRGIR